jgi:SAM-dependent methyltransferase
MAENRKGLYQFISFPWVYNLIQLIAGAPMYRNNMVKNYVKPFEGCKILDIGCGTGEYIEHLKKYVTDFEYNGFDGEQSYIDSANEKYKDEKNIHFFQKMLTEDTVKEFNNYDIVMAIGLMHHLDDPIVVNLLQIARKALKPGGIFVTYDTGIFDNMTLMEKFFAKADRGRSIRTQAEYEALVKQAFTDYEVHSPVLTYYNSRNYVFVCRNS